MPIDLSAALRKVKPEQRLGTYSHRPHEALVSAQSQELVFRQKSFLADTNVYIEMAAGRAPAEVGRLISDGLLYHCSVCLGEIATGLAMQDPTHPRWKEKTKYFANLFARIPKSRLLTPDENIWIESCLVSGTLARVQNYQPMQRKEALNDELIYLTAAKRGMPVLTSNIGDFDLLQQITGRGEFWYYAKSRV